MTSFVSQARAPRIQGYVALHLSAALQAPNLSAARIFALAASSSRFFGGALVSSDRSNRVETPATSSTAARNTASLVFDGLVKPLIFLTNWSDAARTSSGVTGGSKLKSVLIFLHISLVCNKSYIPFVYDIVGRVEFHTLRALVR